MEEVFGPLYCLFASCLCGFHTFWSQFFVFGVQASEHLEEFFIHGIIIVKFHADF